MRAEETNYRETMRWPWWVNAMFQGSLIVGYQ